NTVTATITVGTGGNVSRPDTVAITPDGTKAYVGNYGASTVMPITVSGNTPGTAITSVTNPQAIAITPDGATAYVAEDGNPGHVLPITVSNNSPGTAIAVGNSPYAIAITPDQATAYVANYGAGSGSTVTPITLSNN